MTDQLVDLTHHSKNHRVEHAFRGKARWTARRWSMLVCQTSARSSSAAAALRTTSSSPAARP